MFSCIDLDLFLWLAHDILPWLRGNKILISSLGGPLCQVYLITFNVFYKQSWPFLQFALRQCSHKSNSWPLTSMYLVPRWCLCLFNASSLCSPFSNLINASPFLLPWAFKQKAIPPLMIIIIIIIIKNIMPKLNYLMIPTRAAITLQKFSSREIATTTTTTSKNWISGYCNSRVFIGLATMGCETLYHALHIW